jgi:hypothetical protein
LVVAMYFFNEYVFSDNLYMWNKAVRYKNIFNVLPENSGDVRKREVLNYFGWDIKYLPYYDNHPKYKIDYITKYNKFHVIRLFVKFDDTWLKVTDDRNQVAKFRADFNEQLNSGAFDNYPSISRTRTPKLIVKSKPNKPALPDPTKLTNDQFKLFMKMIKEKNLYVPMSKIINELNGSAITWYKRFERNIEPTSKLWRRAILIYRHNKRRAKNNKNNKKMIKNVI